MRRIRFSLRAFLSVAVSTLIMSPLFGNFTPERLPILLVLICVLGSVWAIIFGTFISSK